MVLYICVFSEDEDIIFIDNFEEIIFIRLRERQSSAGIENSDVGAGLPLFESQLCRLFSV